MVVVETKKVFKVFKGSKWGKRLMKVNKTDKVLGLIDRTKNHDGSVIARFNGWTKYDGKVVPHTTPWVVRCETHHVTRFFSTERETARLASNFGKYCPECKKLHKNRLSRINRSEKSK